MELGEVLHQRRLNVAPGAFPRRLADLAGLRAFAAGAADPQKTPEQYDGEIDRSSSNSKKTSVSGPNSLQAISRLLGSTTSSSLMQFFVRRWSNWKNEGSGASGPLGEGRCQWRTAMRAPRASPASAWRSRRRRQSHLGFTGRLSQPHPGHCDDGTQNPIYQHRNAYQELPHAPMYAAVTKFQADVATIEQAPYLVPQAFREAMSGTRRPTISISTTTGAPTSRPPA